jgi:hypothetical protein
MNVQSRIAQLMEAKFQVKHTHHDLRMAAQPWLQSP